MASKNIRGITIEIGGDTGPLGKALQEVNKKARELETELKEVNKLLKLDPDNAVLVAQKQKILADSVTNTKGKLETLKEAEKQAQAQFKKGELSEEQYRALQREVVDTETKLKSLEAQGRQTNAVLSKDEAIGNLKNIAKAAGAAGIAVGGALVASAVKAGQNADDINTLAKQTGLATDTIQKFQFASDRIDVSMDTLTGSLSKLTKNMAGAKDGTGPAAEAFAQLGVSIVDSQGNLRDNEDVFNETINALGTMTNETERDALAMQLFGKSAQDLNPLILGGADALKEMSKEAEEAGLILSQDALDSANAFADGMDEIKAVSSGIFAKVGTEVAEGLLPMLNGLLDLMTTLPTWISENSTLLTILAIAFGTITALVIAFNIQQALLASGMTLWGAVAGFGTTVTTALGAAFAFLTSPIGLIIIAIGALIAIGVLLYKNWDTVKAKATELWSKITTTFENIKTGVSQKVDAVKTSVTTAFGKIQDTMTKPFDRAKEIIGGVIEKIKGFLNFQWSFPKLKMPHFSIKNASLNPMHWITNGMPKLSVDWYAKGAIFKQPTLFNTPYGMKGVGDNLQSPEVVAPLHELKKMLGLDGGQGSGLNVNIENFINNRKQDVQAFAEELEFYKMKVAKSKGGS